MLLIDSASLIGLTYLLPVALLVTATLPVTLSRVLHQRRVTNETVLGALCSYVLLGLLFAFVYLAVNEANGPFFSQPDVQSQSEFVYFSFVTLTTLGFGDLSPAVGLPQALTVLEALSGQDLPRHHGGAAGHGLGTPEPGRRRARCEALTRDARRRPRRSRSRRRRGWHAPNRRESVTT